MRIFKNLRKPTPKKAKMIGNFLVAVSLLVGGYEAILDSHPYIGVFLALLGALGKFISMFWAEEEEMTEQ